LILLFGIGNISLSRCHSWQQQQLATDDVLQQMLRGKTFKSKIDENMHLQLNFPIGI